MLNSEQKIYSTFTSQQHTLSCQEQNIISPGTRYVKPWFGEELDLSASTRSFCQVNSGERLTWLLQCEFYWVSSSCRNTFSRLYSRQKCFYSRFIWQTEVKESNLKMLSGTKISREVNRFGISPTSWLKNQKDAREGQHLHWLWLGMQRECVVLCFHYTVYYLCVCGST